MSRTKVRDMMTNEVVTLPAEGDVVLATMVMEMRRIRHVPVVRGSELVGIVTHRDPS